MGKYRLKSRQAGSVITLMEIDTESRAWYIKADYKEAALKALKDMGPALACVETIYINGDDVSSVVFAPAAPMMDPDMPPMDFLPPEEPMESYSLAPDIPVFPTANDIVAAQEAEMAVPAMAEETPMPGISMPSSLPSLSSVLPKSAFIAPSPAAKKSGAVNGIYLGRKHITGEAIEIRSVNEEKDGVIFVGTVISIEVRELRSKKKLLLMNLADETNGIPCKKFFDRPEEAEAVESLKPGTTVKVRGNVRLDKYSGGLVLELSQMEKGETVKIDHEDNYETPRVELHLHTKMSLDGLIDNEEIIKTAAKWHHPAVAITDHGVIQAFPKIQDLADKYHQKVIYGMEGYMIDEIPADPDADRQQYGHIIILAKNITGLRNLYRMVTLSHLKFYRKRPLIPKPILEELHEGLIYGSACVMGEFFRAVLAGESDEELIQKAKFYDYLEVQPLGNNEFLINDDKYGKINTKKDLEDLNRKVIEIADKAGMPCCATSDAHYMFAEDQRNRDILLSNWEKPGKIESHPPVYIRTTQEMLDEFSYLPKEKAIEIVVTNTRKIAEQCEVLKPLAEEWKSYNPKIAGADEKLVKMCYDNAKAIYGDPLPKVVQDRLTLELTPIINHGYGVLYYIAHKLVKHSNDRGYLVGSRGSVGSSFVATMSGITEVNPLPPHYVCPKCHWTHFFEDGSVGGGFDLPEYGTPFVRGMLEDTRPKNFSELVRISGFSHGTDVWLNNAQDLIKNGIVKLEDAISTRDDVMNYLIQHGVKPLTSFKVMENVRKGKGLEKGGSNNRAELDAAHVPQWFIDSCLKIGYLFPRAHAVAYVMMAFRIAWFKVYQPLAYYAAYFTIRAEGSFNAPVILRGLASMKQELARIAALDKPTAVEKGNATVIEVAAEMYLRGLSFLPIDLEKSDASQFLMVDGKLLPPFNCIPALGDAVAKEIVLARQDHPFTSKEDLKKRGKVSQSIIDTLDSMGVLKGLPEEEQMSLFAF